MHDELDELMSEGFLASLSDENVGFQQEQVDKPVWVQRENHTTYRAWQSILVLKAEKEKNILTFGNTATSKTPKSIYQIKKSEIAKNVGISAQSMFSASSFSSDLSKFFDEINESLLKLHAKEQKKQKKRYCSGVRSKVKEDVVKDYQKLNTRVRELECQNAKEILDLLIGQLPFDLAQRLKR